MLGANPMYRPMLAVDIEKSAGRGDVVLLRNRDVLRRAVQEAVTEAGVEWEECHRDDSGDGLVLVLGRDVRKASLIHPLVPSLAGRLRAANLAAGPREAIRVRMALHAGDVHIADGEVVGGSLEYLARLLDAPPLRRVLAAAPESATAALIVSGHVFTEVVRHGYEGIDKAAFHAVDFTVKETTDRAWVHLPGHAPDPAALRTEASSGNSDRPARPRADRPAIAARYVTLVEGGQVGEVIGSIGNRIDHVTGDVHIGGSRQVADDVLRRELAELGRALVREERAGRLDPETYEAAADELRAANSYLARTDASGRSRLVLALKRLKGIVDGVADLATKVATIIATARGVR